MTAITFEFGGASGTLPKGPEIVPQKEGTLYRAPHEKILPNKQFAFNTKQILIVFNQGNSNQLIFFNKIGKRENVRIRDLVKS